MGTFSRTVRALFRPSPLVRAAAQDPWKVLGLSRTASDKEVKEAYLKLAKQYHPDLNPKGEEKFKAVKQAYESIQSGEASKTQGTSRPSPGKSYQQYARTDYSGANPFYSQYQYKGPGVNYAQRAWSQRVEFYKQAQEAEETRQRLNRELDSFAKVLIWLILIALLFPIFGSLSLTTSEEERRRRQEEFERIRRLHAQNRSGQFQTPTQQPPTPPGSENYQWVWVHPYGWQWLPVERGPDGLIRVTPPAGFQTEPRPPQFYLDEEAPNHPSSSGDGERGNPIPPPPAAPSPPHPPRHAPSDKN